MENNELKKICIKNQICHYLVDIIKLEDFNIDNFLIHEKLPKNIVIYDI